MNKIVIFVVLFFLCLACVCKNETHEIFRLSIEYIPEKKLSKWDFIKTTQDKDIYKLLFKEYSLPYVLVDDSLFNIKLSDEMFVLYYNCSLSSNTGFIMYGTNDNKELQIVQMGRIILCECFSIDKQQLLLKVIENVGNYLNPAILKTHYFLFSPKTHLSQKNMTMLSCASFFHDTSTIQLKDSITNSQIIIQGFKDRKRVAYSIKIEDGDFGLSKQDENILFGSMKVFEKGNVFSKTVYY